MEIEMKLPGALLPTFSDIKPGELFSFNDTGGLYLKIRASVSQSDNAIAIQPGTGSYAVPGGRVIVDHSTCVYRVGKITVNLEYQQP